MNFVIRQMSPILFDGTSSFFLKGIITRWWISCQFITRGHILAGVFGFLTFITIFKL
jgi:hypothetical protein